MSTLQFIHSLVDGHFSDFQFIVVISRSAMNIPAHIPSYANFVQEFFLVVYPCGIAMS